jgi:ankyrin repeat protein
MNVEREHGSVIANDQLVSDSIRSTASLPCLGNDVLLLIADCLESERSINALVRTNRRLYLLLNSYLYRYNVVNAKSSALHWAAIHGQKRSAAESIAQGGGLESKEYRYGRTPLCQAAENGHTNFVNLLIEAGVELEHKDSRGRTPLSWAAAIEHGHFTIAKLLVEAGAELEPKDDRGRTPLSWAKWKNRRDIVKLLLDAGAENLDKNGHRTFQVHLKEAGSSLRNTVLGRR